MSNLTQETLTSLLTGKLAFKVYNNATAEWELVRLNNPDLEAHTGATASLEQVGHVQLTNALDLDSEVLAPTAKALSVVFGSVSSHVNEEGIHLTSEQNEQLQMFRIMQDNYNDILTRLGRIERALLESDETILNRMKSNYSTETPIEEQ